MRWTSASRSMNLFGRNSHASPVSFQACHVFALAHMLTYRSPMAMAAEPGAKKPIGLRLNDASFCPCNPVRTKRRPNSKARSTRYSGAILSGRGTRGPYGCCK